MKSLFLRAALCIALFNAGSVFAGETTLNDDDGSTAWLYTPTEKPDPAKTYWLVVGVHGVGTNGKGACGAAYLAKAFDDVIVLGPSFGQPKRVEGAPRPPGMPRDSYQMSGPTHEAKLAALIAEVGKTWKLHPKIVVHGFSAGAQFAHRFAFKHPEQVAGVSAHSGGSWAKLEGDDKINPAAKSILFAVSCGEDDNGSGGPPGTATRIDGAKQFAENLKSLGFTLQLRTWPGVAHDFAPGLMPMTKALVEKVRAASARSETAAGDRAVIEETPGLVAFWTFAEEAGQPRISNGTQEKHSLTEVGGPIARVEGGPFSGYSAELNGKQYFKIPYAETGDLNISGKDAQVSMFAVVLIRDLKQSRTIAGMWSEGKGKDDDSGTRQYAMLMNMPTYGGARQLVPHISSEGGVTYRADGSKFPWCADYAASRSEVPEDQWCSLGFTYDGKYIRAYVNGLMEERPLDPAKDKRTDRYFTTEGPSGKDRGMNPYFHGRGIFNYDHDLHAVTKPGGGADFTVGARYAVGTMLGEATKGRFGGLAVFNRALTDAEMNRLHDAANIATLKGPDQ